MPETAVNEDNGSVFGKDKIRLPRKRTIFRTVDGKSVAKSVKHSSQG